MPVCSECGDDFDEALGLDAESLDEDGVQRLYRAIAEGEGRIELLQRVYDLFATQCNLSPPVCEAGIADAYKPKVAKHG